MLLSLDYVYLPAPDIDSAVKYYAEALGGELLWRIRDGETLVAAVKMGDAMPQVVLANHLAAGEGLLIWRVESVAATKEALASRGWTAETPPFELPQGPCVVFRDPGGQRLAAYERTRPEADVKFRGRFDE